MTAPKDPSPKDASAKEATSLRAAALEAAEMVTLSKEFYGCVMKDPRTRSGAHFQAVRPLPVIIEGEESLPASSKKSPSVV